MDCTENSREHDESAPARAEPGSSAGVGTTLGLLPLLAVSAAMSSSAFAQSSVSVDEITVGGGGTPASAAAPDEDYAEPEPAPASPADLSLRDGGAGVLNPGQLSSSKATAPILNTPQTISVIPGTIIQQRNSTTLTEALRNTPGITFDAGENGFGTGGNTFNLRGFNSSGSVFVDGTRDSGSYARDTFNIEGIEVVKGAASDNGRGTAGGYINQVTKTPRLGNFIVGDVGIGFDEYDSEMRRRAMLDVNQAFGTVGVRLNTMIQDGGLAGRDVAEANTWGVAPSLAFGLGTGTRVTFAYEHFERNDVPDSGVAVNRSAPAFGVGVKGAGPRPFAQSVSRDTFFGDRTDYDDVNADSFLARFEYDLAPGITISNQTRYESVSREAKYHIAGTGASIPAGAPFYNERDNEGIFNQTNLSAKFNTGALRHSLSAGFELARETADSVRFNGPNPTQTSDVQVDTLSYYLYDTIELSRHWQVMGGVRVDHWDVELSGQGIPGVTGDYSDSGVSVGGNVGVVYKPVKEGSIYAAYGTSNLPHGALLSNADSSREDDNGFPTFVAHADPVRIHNYEVGVKWDWFDGKLSTTAAAFHTVKDNVAYRGLNGPVYGEQEVQGIELGIAGNLTDRWKVYGGVTFLDSERKHGAAVDAALSGSPPNGDYYPGGADTDPRWAAANPGGVTTTNGDELALTPNFFATLWMTYDLTDKFTFGGGIQYVGESFIGRPDDAHRVIPNGKFGKLPDYFLVNLYASYDITDNIELALNVDNVFDETYLTTMNWNGRWGYLGAPRTYWLSANFKY